MIPYHVLMYGIPTIAFRHYMILIFNDGLEAFSMKTGITRARFIRVSLFLELLKGIRESLASLGVGVRRRLLRCCSKYIMLGCLLALCICILVYRIYWLGFWLHTTPVFLG